MSFVDHLRSAAAHPRVVPLTALLLRARTVRRTAAFVARELAGRGGTFAYEVRENGLQAVIRHGTGDVVTLGEVFHEHDYMVPPEVAGVLGDPANVLDLGANVGLFGLYATGRWPSASVLAYEPDPANAGVHRAAIARNGRQDRWRLVEAAAGATAGEARFASGGIALSALDDAGDIVVPVHDVLHAVVAADLVKMDIEGGEWAILTDPRFAASPPTAIVLEYHPGGGCPGPDPHLAIQTLITGAGLSTQEIWRRDDGHGMLWAWRS